MTTPLKSECWWLSSVIEHRVNSWHVLYSLYIHIYIYIDKEERERDREREKGRENEKEIERERDREEREKKGRKRERDNLLVQIHVAWRLFHCTMQHETLGSHIHVKWLAPNLYIYIYIACVLKTNGFIVMESDWACQLRICRSHLVASKYHLQKLL